MLLIKWFAWSDPNGLDVNQVTLTPNSNVSLPPFADALQLLDEEPDSLEDDPSEDSEEGGRDILGEMEIAARIMITGGDERESARMTRPDRLMIREAILSAAQNVREAGRGQVLTEDVVETLRSIGRDSTLPERKRERATDMGDSRSSRPPASRCTCTSLYIVASYSAQALRDAFSTDPEPAGQRQISPIWKWGSLLVRAMKTS